MVTVESDGRIKMGDDSLRTVELTRIEKARFKATNVRGGTLEFGEGDDEDFTPVELLLAAIAGCTAIDVDYIVGKRVDPVIFDVHAQGDKVNDSTGNHMTNLSVTFTVTFPEGEDGDAALKRLPNAIKQSHDRICTVSRTVQLGAPVESKVAGT